jgi:hypothetical protein
MRYRTVCQWSVKKNGKLKVESNDSFVIVAGRPHQHGSLSLLSMNRRSSPKKIHRTTYTVERRAMNVDVNAASDNWEKLFEKLEEEFDEEGEGDGFIYDVDLSDSEADRYDFGNELLMSRIRERLVAALQRSAYSISYLTFGNKFFMTMNEQQQQSFFLNIFNLPVSGIRVGEETDNITESSAITISTSALLEALPHLHECVESLVVSNFALTRRSDVQALSNAFFARTETLDFLALKSIECPVEDCNKEDSDETDGFLDPLFYAASVWHAFCVSAKTRSVDSTLVSPRALRALFIEGKEFSLRLNGLGLTDSHALAIVDGLSTPGTRLHCLNLESNPGISAQGYGTLVNLINRANVVGCFDSLPSKWTGFRLDDKAWEGKLNLVSEMNSDYHHLKYLTNGSFTSEEHRWQWLEKVANLPIPDRNFRGTYEEWDAKHLNFIWYTLCQNPAMMQT